MKSVFIYTRIIFLLFTLQMATLSHAQEIDTSVVVEENYDDEELEAPIKHIYDSSERYFNWIGFGEDASLKKRKDNGRDHRSRISAFKKDEAFWYVDAIEQVENNYLRLSFEIDSLNAANRYKDRKTYIDEEERRRRTVDVELSEIADGRNFFRLSPFWIILLSCLVVGGLLFVVLQRKRFLARKDHALRSKDALGDETDIFSISYTDMITRAEQARNHALAIRLRYLFVLKTFSEKGLLQYRPELTNMDYLMQLRGTAHYSAFAAVTRHYEYSWYGQFPVSEEAYGIIRNEFIELQNNLGI